MMTYRQLEKWIGRLDESQKDCDVTAFLSGQTEYIPLEGVFCEEESDVLDKGHPVLEFDF
jgi:hypothetical protein